MYTNQPGRDSLIWDEDEKQKRNEQVERETLAEFMNAQIKGGNKITSLQMFIISWKS